MIVYFLINIALEMTLLDYLFFNVKIKMMKALVTESSASQLEECYKILSSLPHIYANNHEYI